MAIGNAQHEPVGRRPDADALPLLDHDDEPAPLGMAQRLNNFEDDRVAERRIRHLELALAHHSLGQLARIELAIGLQMAQANVGDLALLEEAVADDVVSTFLLTSFDQTDHSADVCEVVSRLRDLGL